MSLKLRRLVKQYQKLKAEADHKTLAIKESEIWKLARKEKKAPPNRRLEWLGACLGCTPYDCKVRYTMLRCGAWADPLFKKLDDEELSTHMVSDFITCTRKHARAKKKPFPVVLDYLFENWDGVPSHIRTIPWEDEPKVDAPKSSPARSRQFRQMVLHEAKKLVDGLTAGTPIDPAHKESILEEFEISLRQLISDITAEVRKGVHTAEKELGPEDAEEFQQACAVLSLSLRYGEPITKRGAAHIARVARKRAGGLHTDKKTHIDKARLEAARLEFDQVNKAREYLLKRYPNRFRSNDG
jgi:hypothetical protein